MPQAAPTAAARKPLHIFKPGRWTTMAGEAIEFSEADLAATARAYDPKLHKAPIVKGHPATDAPAQGWAAALVADGRGLFAAAEKVDPAFAEEVRAGRYGTVSAKFYRPDSPANPVPGVWYLRHIGVLGAQPPAVKGLDSPEFAEDADSVAFQETVEFGAWDAVTSAGLWRSLRDWLINKFGQDEADKVLPSYQVASLETGAAEDMARREGAQPAFADPNTPPPKKESAVDEAEAARLREENAKNQRELTELRARETARERKAVEADATAFAEGLARDARIPAAGVPLIAAVLTHLQAAAAPVEFGEGDAKKPMHTALRETLQALPPHVEFGEQATRGRAAGEDDGDPEFGETPDARAALDKRIRTYMAEHKVGYVEACQAVTAR